MFIQGVNTKFEVTEELDPMYHLHETTTGKNIFKEIAKTPSAPWSEVSEGVSHFGRGTLFETPWTVARHAPVSMDFPGKNTGSGLPFPSSEDLPTPGKEPQVLCTVGRLFTIWATKKWNLYDWEQEATVLNNFTKLMKTWGV